MACARTCRRAALFPGQGSAWPVTGVHADQPAAWVASKAGYEARQAHAGGVCAVKAHWLRRCGELRCLAPVESRCEVTPAMLLTAAREQTSVEPVAGAEVLTSISATDEGALLA